MKLPMDNQTKTLNLLVLFLFIGLFLSSCSNKYTAHFTYSEYNNKKLVTVEPVVKLKGPETSPMEILAEPTAQKSEISNEHTVSSELIPSIEEAGKMKTPELLVNSQKVELSDARQTEIIQKLNQMSRSERKALKSEVKQGLRNDFNKSNSSSDISNNMLLLILITILLPPLGVYLVYDVSQEFWISLILTILGFLPGLIYSLIIILK